MSEPSYVASLQPADPLASTIVVSDGLLLDATSLEGREQAAALLRRAVEQQSEDVAAAEITASSTNPDVDLHVALATTAGVPADSLTSAVELVAEASGTKVDHGEVTAVVAKLAAGKGMIERLEPHPLPPAESAPLGRLARLLQMIKQAWAQLFNLERPS